MAIRFRVQDEVAPLRYVVLGRGEGYHRDAARIEIVNEVQRQSFETRGRLAEAQVVAELANARAAMERAGVTVHQPDLAPDSEQDQTCPRDIGFVIGDTFVTAGMRHASRAAEIDGIAGLLRGCDGPRVSVPQGVSLEGGDVIVDGQTVFVGAGQRSDPEGAAFLQAQFGETHRVCPVPTRPLSEGQDVLHLDCAFNPLGLCHVLIYPGGLADIPDEIGNRNWIEVTQAEATALATNVLSLSPGLLLARDHPDCARVNGLLRQAGYQVEEVTFDAVPFTGGSFRCATLPLWRG